MIELKHNKVDLDRVDVYHNGEFFANVNELEWLDIRLQVKTHKITGVYGLWNDHKIEINLNGKHEWPEGFMCKWENYLFALL